MKLTRLIALVLTVLMIASLSTVCLTANAAEVETAETGALGSYYNVNYLETKAYNGTDLGSTYTPSKTTWKVWSPEAKSVKLNLYKTGSDLENGAENLGTHTLKKDNATGVWSLALDGDFKNVYYTYTVETTQLGAMETYDIYAKACGVNGNRSMVVDLDSTDPEGWENDQHVFQDQVTDKDIWEVHIADLTSSDNSGVSPEYQGKFLGFAEGGLTYNGKSTGIDYLVEQGIKVVHIQCPFDFASGDERNDESYNWGYDPKNYNVPEGLYSTNPYDGNVRITEFKQLIQALHDRGISVVMGVVYNHTFGSDKSPFTYTVPGYYYRMESATQYINCTACGNTLATDKKMFKNYMMQSLKYWAEEYHVDGFRFDLMGAHDYQIMNEIRSMFDKMYNGEGKKIIMYGEPWTGTLGFSGLNASNQCTISNSAKLSERIGCFNDVTRDAIKAYFNGTTTEKATVKSALESKTAYNLKPNKSLTYYDCHDGLTWWDTLSGTGKYDSTDATLRSKHRTSMTYLFTSRGIPFMLAGTEFARTKYGNGNSYNAGDVNAFDWKRIETYATEVAYVKGLREIRDAFSPFRSQTAIVPQYINTGDNVIAYSLNNTKAGEWSKAVVIVNVGSAASVTLPSGSWTVVADGNKAGLTSLGTASGSYSVPANGSAILVQGETTAKSATYETVTVKHVADGKTIKTTESLYAVGDTWRAVPDNYTLFNHNVVSIESNAGTKLGNTYYGTVEAGKDVVVTITYESFNTDGYVTIKYVDDKGKSIATDIKFRMLNGEKYNLPFSNVSGYELDSSKYPVNYKGTFDSSKPATITFVYKQIKTDAIKVYYYNSLGTGGTLRMYAYTDAEEKPLGGWNNKAQNMEKVNNVSELPKGESVGNWYKKVIDKTNNQLDYLPSSCNVMFLTDGTGKQEPLNGEPGYVAAGTIYVKNKVLSFNTDVIVSHIDAETGKKVAEDERISFTNVSLKDTYETKAKEGLGEVIVPTNAKGNVVAGSICVVYLYGAKQEQPTTVVTEPTSSEVPTATATAPVEPGTSEVPTATATAPVEPGTSEVPTATAPTEPKTEVTTTVPVQTTAPEPEYIEPLYLGDSDLSGVVNIKDATVVQKHAAFLLMLVGDGLTCADANADTNVNVKDATVIQKYLAKMETPYAVGELIPGTGVWTTVPVATTPAATEPPVTAEPGTTVLGTVATTVADPTTEPTTAEPIATTEPTEATTVKPTETEPTVTVEPTTEEPVVTDPIEDTDPTEPVTDPPEDPTDPPYDDPVYDTYSVCFSNNKRWAGTVYAYTWDPVGGENAAWPGVPMTYYDSNEYGEDRYVYDVTPGHTFIIFTDGTSKSTDVDLTQFTDFGFYLLDTQDAEGGYDIGNYPFI